MLAAHHFFEAQSHRPEQILSRREDFLCPCDHYLWGVLERESNKRAHNTFNSLKTAIIQAVVNLTREQVRPMSSPISLRVH